MVDYAQQVIDTFKEIQVAAKRTNIADVAFRILDGEDWSRIFVAETSKVGRAVLETFHRNGNRIHTPVELGLDVGSSQIDQLNRALRRPGYYIKKLNRGVFWEQSQFQIYVRKDVERLRATQPGGHEELKRTISDELVQKINHWRDYDSLLDHICIYDPAEACALIDRLISLVSAFILVGLQLRAQHGNERAKAILDRASILEIRGTKGICHARDELFEETGIFLC